MCEAVEESNLHMFFQCGSSLQIWYELSLLYGFPHVVFVSVQAAFQWCCAQKDTWRSLFIIVLWSLWKWRIAKIFQDSKEPLKSSMHHILSSHDMLPVKQHKMKSDRKKEVVDPLNCMPRAFFDGAEQNNICGCGVHVIMDEKLQYFLSWNGGSGTNSLAEARALVGLLAFCVFF